MSGLCGARSAPEQYDYETVWSGGGGLTTVGSQRRGAVVRAIEGGVEEWYERVEDHRGKRHAKVFAGDPHGQLLASAHIIADDRAALTLPATRVVNHLYARQWRVTLLHDRRRPWPYCQLCGFYLVGSRALTGETSPSASHHLIGHASVCQSCYVRYRQARGTWPGTSKLVMHTRNHWRLGSDEERRAHRIASARKSVPESEREAAAPAPPRAATRDRACGPAGR